MNKINVGLIGFGLSGRVFHAPLLKACDQFEIVKVYSSRESEVKKALPEADVVGKVEDIFKDETIDLVILTGPNHTHFEQGKMALEASKHVVVEKPFVISSDQGQELIDLAKDQGLILSVFHNRRWDSDFLGVKQLIEEGSLGEIKEFHSHFDRWRPEVKEKWKEAPGQGTGTLFDLGAHLIDQCLELFGWPEAIFADLDDQRNNKAVVDYFHLILKYKKMRAILHSSSFTLKTPRFSILGSKGSYFKEGFDPQEERLAKGISPLGKDFAAEIEEDRGKIFLNENDKTVFTSYCSPEGKYCQFYDSLAQAIIKNEAKSVPVTGQSALKVIELIEGALKSYQEKKWIKL